MNTCISYFFENDLSDFDAKQLKLIINEQKDIVYGNSGSGNQSLTEQSKSWIGFSSVIFFGGGEDVKSTPEVMQERLHWKTSPSEKMIFAIAASSC